MPATRYSLLATLLRRYFCSGWAFLIPYLAAYLLYYATGWPVNPATEISSTAPSPSPFAPPPLLHLYWALHAIHVILAGAALWSWLQDRRAASRLAASSYYSLPATRYSLLTAPAPYSSYRLHLLTRIAPWAILALIFYIPGVYLEWPSDPWEHLRRINEWHSLDTVGAHSSWHKSSYFIPYSFLGWCTGLRQLFWLDFYYTGICLLLCWQYYRLSRTCGLSERASMVFVIVQALLFGNNIFSFYRYYGISSSIYAQLGAIALTHIVLAWAARGTSLDRSPSTTRYPLPSTHDSARAYSLLITRYSLLRYPSRPPFWHLPSLLRLLAAGLCLLVLIAFNHAQGLGIAGLGILAVIVWRIIEWKRSMVVWIVSVAIFSSIAIILWFPRNPALDGVYRVDGWLSPLYGFNIFLTDSPAFDRTAQVLGAFGALNAGIAVWLIVRKHHIVGWLTLIPILALALPCFALPIAQVISSQTHANNIITFHRFLFGIPMGLAVITMCKSVTNINAGENAHKLHRSLAGCYSLVCIGLAAATVLPSGFSCYNRFWNSMQRISADLRLRQFVEPLTPATVSHAKDATTAMIDTVLGADVYQCFVPRLNPSRYSKVFRSIDEPLDSAELGQRLAWLSLISKRTGPAGQEISASSLAGQLTLSSQHLRAATPLPYVRRNSSVESWTTLFGSHHQHDSTNAVSLISNPPGAVTHVFSSELISLAPGHGYLLTCTVRQRRGSLSTNYLAVIWYDREKKALSSLLPQPEGAGDPPGWSNGTYSYYGLRGEPAPREWKPYTITFGYGLPASIPANAAFMRIGALLNYHATPDVQVQLTAVHLQSKPIQHLILLPAGQPLHTFASLAGYLSGHWSPQQVPLDHAAINELRDQLVPQGAARLPLFPP